VSGGERPWTCVRVSPMTPCGKSRRAAPPYESGGWRGRSGAEGERRGGGTSRGALQCLAGSTCLGSAQEGFDASGPLTRRTGRGGDAGRWCWCGRRCDCLQVRLASGSACMRSKSVVRSLTAAALDCQAPPAERNDRGGHVHCHRQLLALPLAADAEVEGCAALWVRDGRLAGRGREGGACCGA